MHKIASSGENFRGHCFAYLLNLLSTLLSQGIFMNIQGKVRKFCLKFSVATLYYDVTITNENANNRVLVFDKDRYSLFKEYETRKSWCEMGKVVVSGSALFLITVLR